MDLKSNSPQIKFEDSPVESFLSTPGENWGPLFGTSGASNTSIHDMEMMTPKSFTEDDSCLASILGTNPEGSPTPDAAAPAASKKPAKKRKSWGQVLPEPKTHLPPRKRAKTEDEKEQRRVERVLRNRRAAQSSRERKRLEVEALEKQNKELKDLLRKAQNDNFVLASQLARFQRDSGVVARNPPPLDSLHNNSITLSKELFSSQDDHEPKLEASGAFIDEILHSNGTVNPASLSPELGPVADPVDTVPEPILKDAKPTEHTVAFSPDVTQCPAATLCDLQCHMSAEKAQSLSTKLTLALFLQLRITLLSAWAILSACQRPLTQIAISSKAGFSLLPSPQLLTTIIWLVTIRPPSLSQTTTSTSATTSSKKRIAAQTLWQRATTPLPTWETSSRSTTLRIKALRKILSSSPQLARPLLDATLLALRLVSKGCDDQVRILRCNTKDACDFDRQLLQCLESIPLPSKEVLMALSLALKIEVKRLGERNGEGVGRETSRRQSAKNPQQEANEEKQRKAGVDSDVQERCRLL